MTGILLLLIGSACVITTAGSPFVVKNFSWDSLVNAEPAIFPEEVGHHGCTFSNMNAHNFSIISQLSSILDEPQVLKKIYKKYLLTVKLDHANIFDDRLKIFKNALLEIAQHNVEAASGKFLWTQGVNQFTDMTEQEIMSTITCNGMTPDFVTNSSITVSDHQTNPPEKTGDEDDSKDWREEGVVSPIKSQGQYGTCWAFSATGTLECAHAIRHPGQILDLSVQELVDCHRSGQIDRSMQYMQKPDGITTTSAYPYKGKRGTCVRGNKRAAARVETFQLKQYEFDDPKGETELKISLDTYGPVAVILGADGWGRYHDGIYDVCEQKYGHAVVVVGNGREAGHDYWILKNSWGRNWGEKGYIRLRCGTTACGIGRYIVSAVAV